MLKPSKPKSRSKATGLRLFKHGGSGSNKRKADAAVPELDAAESVGKRAVHGGDTKVAPPRRAPDVAGTDGAASAPATGRKRISVKLSPTADDATVPPQVAGGGGGGAGGGGATGGGGGGAGAGGGAGGGGAAAGAGAGGGGAAAGAGAPSAGRSTNRVAETVAEFAADRRWNTLGVAPWLVTAVHSMGMARPTPVQAGIIPAILRGDDVVACSQTGTGKTAAFAIPLLSKLSQDPYGVFAVVLTPGRELAHQIGEQFTALGAAMRVRVTVATGGVDFLKQAKELSSLPHVVVATPGRLAALLSRGGASRPRLDAVACVVLDEADRLMDPSIAPDLATILDALPPPTARQTLLISATISTDLKAVKALALQTPFVWEATPEPTTVSALRQEYVVTPKEVKPCHLAHVLQRIGPESPLAGDRDTDLARELGLSSARLKELRRAKGRAGRGADTAASDAGDGAAADADTPRAKSAIVFVGTLYRCQFVVELLTEMGVLCTGLHSAMNQRRRIAALGKFKSMLVPVLVATDVASRGLDIPEVDLVVNYDLPKAPADYIHRVGRTARAGRSGRAVTLVTQHDLALVHRVEQVTGVRMTAMPEFDEPAALKLLKQVSTAAKVAVVRLTNAGFDEAVEKVKARKAESKQRQRDWLADEQAAAADVVAAAAGDDDASDSDH